MGAFEQAALRQSDRAEACGALVPLDTALEPEPALEPFVLRRLLSATPKHLRREGPKPNPFLPWDPELEVDRLGSTHLLLLNKYPVQRGHLLLITQQWRPQRGWLETLDWQALAHVDHDSSGLWFFNSCAEAGASQPHRHLQLLPRGPGDVLCPMQEAIEAELSGQGSCWPWAYQISRRRQSGTADSAQELEQIYRSHCTALALGDPAHDHEPLAPYNLLIGPHWVLSVRRTREHWAGFSINALGFAGYLLCTDDSDLHWLRHNGALSLLEAVADRTRSPQ